MLLAASAAFPDKPRGCGTGGRFPLSVGSSGTPRPRASRQTGCGFFLYVGAAAAIFIVEERPALITPMMIRAIDARQREYCRLSFVQFDDTADVPVNRGKKTTGLFGYRTLGGPTVNSPALLGDKALMSFGEKASALTHLGANCVPQAAVNIRLLF
ncbi:MAG: hypothetical protein JO356_16880 [Acidobacteria bacterium]|nr:hypothetical protein [Acidobacteriota bacterium]